MLPRVISKRPWRPLGSALGCPRGSQDGAKSTRDVAFQHCLETGLGWILEAKLGLSWSQLGPYKGSKWHVKVTSQVSVFLKLKRHSYKKLSWNAFLLVLGAPGRSKNLHFALEMLQKLAFHDIAFQHRLETGLGEILEAKLGLSWSQVGPYKGSKWHVKVTSKLS